MCGAGVNLLRIFARIEISSMPVLVISKAARTKRIVTVSFALAFLIQKPQKTDDWLIPLRGQPILFAKKQKPAFTDFCLFA